MKKLIFTSVFCFVCALFGINANAQSIYVSNTTTPTSCDGYAIFMDSVNLGGYDTFVWMDSTNVLSDSTFVYDLCPGNYTVTCTNPNGGDTTITFTIGAGTVDPCAGFSAYMSDIQHATWGQCDGEMTVTAQGGTTPYTYEWNGAAPTNNTISGLCYNTYNSVTVTDANGCIAFVYGFATDSLNNPCLGFNVSLTSSNITGASVCDGSASASTSGGAAPYAYSWSNSATSASISGLCAGSYTVTVLDSNGCSASGWANMYYNDTIIDSSMVVYTSPTNVSADGECDGELLVGQWGGVAPYTYTLSNGAINTTGYFDSLCQGIYTVTVFDSQGDTVNVNVIISNPGNTYNNNPYGDSLFVDSLLGNLQENCQLNYQGIDSVFITGYDFVGDSIIVYWNVVTSTGSTVITQMYSIGGASGVYSLGLQVYCPGKSIGNYFTATDQIYYTGSPLGINEQTMGEISVYPNPATDLLNIQFSEAGNYEVALYDVMGRTILTEKNNDSDHLTINVSALAKGQYTLLIRGNNGSMSKSVLK